jgi:hypothetical protein
MFILHRQPWGGIFIDHYYKPNKIVGVLEGIRVNVIDGYDDSQTSYFILEFFGPCILYMLHGY